MTEVKNPNPFAPDRPGGGKHEYNIRAAGVPIPRRKRNYKLVGETFICKACLVHGISLDSATRPASDQQESELLGIDLCPHCYDTEQEFLEGRAAGREEGPMYGHLFQRRLHLIDLIVLRKR